VPPRAPFAGPGPEDGELDLFTGTED